MKLNIPDTSRPRVVIIGAGFAGFTLANSLKNGPFQIVLVDKNNYHQFQPLFYQVAMSGLEPSSICFPLRKNFQNQTHIIVRVAEVRSICPGQKMIITDKGSLDYDMLVLAAGAETNYYGNSNFLEHTIPLKSVSEALFLRNRILEDLEHAVLKQNPDSIHQLLDIAIVGGGPTGVELAGSLAEMKRHIIPKDFPDLNPQFMEIHLIQGADRLLNTMSESSSESALHELKKMGVHVHLQAIVSQIENGFVVLNNGEKIRCGKVIWAAGVKAVRLDGLPDEVYTKEGRIIVDEFCKIQSLKEVFAIGDICYMPTSKYPNGLPGVAPVAMQQARYLGMQLIRMQYGKSIKPFAYSDKGSMATIGRNKAVLDFGSVHLQGVLAWIAWLLVHIYYLIGVRNRIIVMINWIYSYIYYDQALRLQIKPYKKK